MLGSYESSMGSADEEAMKFKATPDHDEKTPKAPYEEAVDTVDPVMKSYESGKTPYEPTLAPDPITPYEPGETPYEPTIAPYEPGKTPYEPTLTPDPITPYEPGLTPYEPTVAPETLDFRAEALKLINALSERDNARALERYAGQKPLGALSSALRLFRLRNQAAWVDKTINDPISRGLAPIYTFLDRVGERSISNDAELTVDENLENAGKYTKTPWWRKALKIGAKVAGGIGVAGAMVMTGGAGIATSLLWAGGLKEAYDGAAQTIEQIGWGNKRAQAELGCQAELTTLTDALKARVMNEAEPLTPEEFSAMVQNILETEATLMAQQEKNACGEAKGKVIRSIATSAATLGTGLLAGVPVGEVNYDNNNTALAESLHSATGDQALKAMDESHRVFWSALKGGQFAYNHTEGISGAINDSLNGATATGAEIDKVNNLVNWLNVTMKGEFGSFSLATTDTYGQTAHELGRTLANLDWTKIGAAGAYLIGEMFSHGKKKKEPTPYEPDVVPYEPDVVPYEPDIAPDEPDKKKKRETIGDDGPAIRAPGTYEPGDAEEDPDEEKSEDISEDIEKYVDKEKKATDKYFGRMTEEYKKTVEAVAEDLPPMKDECRFSVCVPAAYSEHHVIYGYLDSFLGQENQDGTPLNPDSYEINIFVNGTVDKAADIAATVAEVNKFKAAHPEINVNVISKGYEERKPLGYLRKVVNDQALLRASQRGNSEGPVYLVSHDADVRMSDKNYFARAMKLDQNYEVKVLAGNIDYSKEVKQKYPFLWVARRLWQYLDLVRTSVPGEVSFQRKAVGANTFVRGESYANVNGFNSLDRVAEDLNLAAKIKNREGFKPSAKNTIDGMDVRLDVSERRDIDQLAKGETLIRGYDKFEENDHVREKYKIDEEKLGEINPDNEEMFKKYLERELSEQYTHLFRDIFTRVSDREPEMKAAIDRGAPKSERVVIENKNLKSKIGTDAIAQANQVAKRACGFLGISFTAAPSPDGDRYVCTITDWSKLKNDLKESLGKM
ncbi:MAG: hypothetical protein WCI57_01820 [Candidatus Berkelbacteria bacterium]